LSYCSYGLFLEMKTLRKMRTTTWMAMLSLTAVLFAANEGKAQRQMEKLGRVSWRSSKATAKYLSAGEYSAPIPTTLLSTFTALRARLLRLSSTHNR
jgi:hypothetical protein